MYSRITSYEALDSLETYFKTLENTGYMRYDNVFSLLALLLVDDFLNTELSTYVSEEDYKTIGNFLYCLFGKNCLIPYPQFIKEIPQIGTILPHWGGVQPFRITEEGIYRNTQKGNPRLTEYRTELWDETWSGKN